MKVLVNKCLKYLSILRFYNGSIGKENRRCIGHIAREVKTWAWTLSAIFASALVLRIRAL